MTDEELIFDHEGNVDVEAIREERNTRNIPPNPPPPAAGGKLDGKALARIAVYDLIDCGSWKKSAFMQHLIDCASRAKGLCFPSRATVARAKNFSVDTATRAVRWWTGHGYSVQGIVKPFLRIAAAGRRKRDGTKEANAYHIGWLPLIALCADAHHDAKVRLAAKKIIARELGQPCKADVLTSQGADVRKARGQM